MEVIEREVIHAVKPADRLLRGEPVEGRPVLIRGGEQQRIDVATFAPPRRTLCSCPSDQLVL
jgi:hypothetical protein